ncbi:MAG: hypothetical protein K2V38_27685, partial [Gemmataceae bacterium]|nr:hypothetical protein [Gemmataceae bacterium]
MQLESLEARDLPAVTILLDYTYDTGFFAARPAAQAVLNQVAAELGNSLTANLAAITPGGGNTWTATFFNPATGANATATNLSVGANTLRVYVGSRPMAGNEDGVGGPGGYSASGSSGWLGTVANRGH